MEKQTENLGRIWQPKQHFTLFNLFSSANTRTIWKIYLKLTIKAPE